MFGIELADSPNSATEFELSNHRGGMISRGIMSGVTGHGANLMIIDDPVKTQEEADSVSRQNKIWNEWLSSFTSRLAPHAKVIIIMTRWSENDLVGRLMTTEGISLKVLNFPKRTICWGASLGRRYALKSARAISGWLILSRCCCHARVRVHGMRCIKDTL